ncbi:chaplin [Streptomyces sp. DH24]|uniref:chaplin n=1 Tax=Streptomyces sp. DH24 TaxID=3040123 RepID=UPI002442675F|nr:chaplin [Streptomyces sp. DH24]MDG9716758.1 chaplin [Streptomyces sp. DH24]
MRRTLSRGMVAAAAATGVLSLCGGTAFADAQADGAAKGSPGAVSGNAVQAPVNVPVNVCGNTLDVIAALNPAFGNTCANVSDDHHHDRIDHKPGHGQEDGSHGAPGHDGSAGHGSQENPHGGDHGSGHDGGHGGGHGGSGHGGGHHTSGASAEGHTAGSPGVGSGNNAQVPVDVPVNACGNTLDVIAVLNPAFGNTCVNDSGGYGETPPSKPKPPHPGHENPKPPVGHTPPAPDDRTPPVDGHHPHTPDVYTPVSPEGGRSGLAETGGDAVFGTAATSAALIGAGAVLYRRARVAARH